MRLSRLVVVVALVTGAACSSTSGAHNTEPQDSSAVPARDAVYPSPVASLASGALHGCPNPTGLRAFAKAAVTAATTVARSYGRVSLSHDLIHSDPSWWRGVRQEWAASKRGRPVSDRLRVLDTTSATKTGYRIIVARSCGTALVERSLTVVVGPPQAEKGPHCNACNITYFLIDRLGHPLVYFAY